MKAFFLKNKYLMTLSILFFVLLIVSFITVKNIFFVDNGNKYGDRLSGIDKVKIKEATINKTKDDLEKTNHVKKVDLRIQGKIIYIIIDFKSDVSETLAKEIATSSLQNFSDNEKEFYDFSYLLTQKENTENTTFPTMGYKQQKTSTIVWIKN